MVKVGCKCLKPSNGAREQLVTNLRSIQRSVGSKSVMTCYEEMMQVTHVKSQLKNHTKN